jgi:hypothetical protein
VRHGKARHRVLDVIGLGADRLHELEAGRSRVEQIAHDDAGSGRERRRLHRADPAALDPDRERALGAARTRFDQKPRDRADRGQRLAAKAERPDIDEIVVRELRGRVALDREREIVRAHAAAVVGDDDLGEAALADRDLDPARPGVERVFDQLLDTSRRPLDHFARRDAVDETLGQAADRHDGTPNGLAVQPFRRRGPSPIAAR